MAHESAGTNPTPRRIPAAAVPLTLETYQPRDCTALLDAIGRTIDELGRQLAATPAPERPGKVIITILTDGAENASSPSSRGVGVLALLKAGGRPRPPATRHAG